MNEKDRTLLMFKLGWRNIWRQKRRSLLVMSSAAFGIMGVLLTMAFANGFFGSMIDMIIDSGLGHVQIRPKGFEETRKSGMLIPDGSNILQKIETSFPNSEHWAPRLEREGLLRAGAFNQGVQLIGIDPEKERGVSSFPDWIQSGDFLFQTDQQDRNNGIIPCVLGQANAKKMEVELNDWSILSVAGTGGSYKSVRCRITGVFQAPAEPLEKFMVFMKREDLSLLYSGEPDKLSYISFMTTSLEEAGNLKETIQSKMGDISGVEFLRYDELEQGFKQMMDMMDSFSFVAYLILLLGVALILFDSVTMSVYERMREIGIILAIGSRSAMVFWMVLYESVILALTGSLAGVVIGWLITLYFQIYGLNLSAFAEGLESMGGIGSTIHPYLSWNNAFQGIIVAVLVSFISGIFPARKAVKIPPVQAIYNR